MDLKVFALPTPISITTSPIAKDSVKSRGYPSESSEHPAMSKSKSLSVAITRLAGESRALAKSSPAGILAHPLSEGNYFLWEAIIAGPIGTPFEGGVFPAELEFPHDYPLSPPKMKFLGDIWHPNGMYILQMKWALPKSSCLSVRLSSSKTDVTRILAHASIWQCTLAAKCAFRSCTRRATTRTIMRAPQSDGVLYRAWRRYYSR